MASPSFALASYALVSMLAIIGMVGGILLLLILAVQAATRRREYIAYLRQHGTRVVAYVAKIKHWKIAIYMVWDERWHYDDTYQVVAVATDRPSGASFSYKSSTRSRKPLCKAGDPVIVFLDAQHSANYHMDI